MTKKKRATIRRKKKPNKRGWRSFFVLLLVLSGSFFALELFSIDEELTAKFSGQRWKLPSKIYSAPFKVSNGVDIKKSALLARLKRLSYRAVSKSVDQPGQYFQSDKILEIYLRTFDYPDRVESGRPFRLSLSHDHRVRELRALSDDKTPSHFFVEPEVIGGFFDSEWEERDLIRLAEVPQVLIDAVLSMEDRRFYEHPGLDFFSIARATVVNLRAGKIVQGGSTLTQQLIKNFYLDSQRTFERKSREALMALLLERRYSKEEILEAYFNEIYFGQNGIMGIYGLGQAAGFYFEKKVSDLSVGESALLAGMIRSPNIFSPSKDIQRSVRRRNLVLEVLFSEGKITLQAYTKARAEKVVAKAVRQRLNRAPYFTDEVRRQLAALYPPRVLNTGGLQIFTSLDPEMQRIAETALREGLEALEKKDPRLKRSEPSEQLQGAIVVLDPQNGAVRAMAGGRSYRSSQFNRATHAKRQPGSLFKPFVYLTAFEESATGGRPYSPISLVDDAPVTLQVGGKDWSPKNYDREYLGSMTLKVALAQSRNTATVRLSQELNLETIIALAQDLGIKSPLKAVPSLALGSVEVSPLEMGVSYSTIANGGVFHPAQFVTAVVDPSGLSLESEAATAPLARRVVSQEAAYLVTRLMQGVVDSGTGVRVRRLGFEAPAAGKTGTTSNLRDAWFAGYTSELVSVVWVGFDQNQRGALTGSSSALPIWTDFMKQASFVEAKTFEAPSGIVFRNINAEGQVCDRDSEEIAFIDGTEPTLSCGKGFFKWLKKLFF